MSGKRGPDEGQKYDWRPEGNLPIMGTMPDEFQPPRSCFDFPNPLAGKKEAHEKYPPIVTIDGRVDTDIDHLIDEEEDYTGPVVDMPSKFPKPHVFTVVEGSLDDDIDNYLNDDGTIEHTLADPPKNFNPSELKDVASNDTTHKSLDLAKRCPTDMPLTNRSYNKTHTEHSENEVTNEIAEGELSINVGSHELCTDDQPSEELVEAGPRPNLVNAAASYDKMDAITDQVVVSSEKTEAVPEGQSEKCIAPQESDSKQAEQLLPKASAMSEIFDKEVLEFRSPSDTFIVTDLERCSNVMYCQEDLSGRGDFILSTVVIENKDLSISGDTDQHTKAEDVLNTLKLAPLTEEVPAQQGCLSALLPPSDKSGTDLDAAHVLAISIQNKEFAEVNVIANSKDSPVAANISIPIICLNEQENKMDAAMDSHVSQDVPASIGQVPVREDDNSDSDIDVTESLALLSKLEEYKGDKQKAKEVLKEFKQLVLEGSQTKLDRLSKSESMQSSLDTPMRSLKNSEHMLNIPQNAVAKSETIIGSATLNGSLKDDREAEKKNSSELDCHNKSMPDQQKAVKHQSEPIVYEKLSKNSEANHSTSPGSSQLPKATESNDGQPNNISESAERNKSEKPDEGQIKHYCSPSADYLVSKYTHFQLAVAVDRELRSQSCDGKIHRMEDSSLGVNDSSNSLCERKTESLRAPRNPPEQIESRKVVSKPGEPVPKQRGNRERSLSSSRKASKYGTHDKKYDGADIKEELPTEQGLSQKNAHKCPSSVKLDKEIPPRHPCSPKNVFSPGALYVDPLHRGENERSTDRIRDRAVSVDRKMAWSFSEGKDHRYIESEVDPKYIRKESAQSIKESLKEAIKVAEESMSAAARVAHALSIVIEATKPKFVNESSTDEEGLREGYDRLMTTMTTLAACKEYRRSHSTSPSKRLAKPLDNVVDLSNVKALSNTQTVSSSHGKLNEHSVDSEKHGRDHKKKEKPNECDRKSSFVSDSSRGREARKPSPRQIHPKPDKKGAEEIAIVKSIEEKQRHEDRVRPVDSKGTNVDGRITEENTEDKQRIHDIKHRAGEDKHAKVKSAEGKHRADSEGRRKHDKDKNRHEEKRHRSSRGKQERSADGRVKGLETKRSAEGLREPKKERAPDATPRHLKEEQEVQKTSSQENSGLIKDRESKGAVLQQITHHTKSAHRSDSKKDESESVPQKLPSQAHVTHSAHQSEETLSQKELHKATHRSSEEVIAPPMPDKEEIGDSKVHPPADETRKSEVGPHEWRIPLTKHNANRKAESIFEQVTLINPIGDGRANKILVRRLLQGSRVDYAESEASETDSLEFDSNFNRVENYGSVEAMLKRQDKARGHSSRQTTENTESISGDAAKYAYVKEWHQECFRHQNKNHSTNQDAMREEMQTAYSYKASHVGERSRPSLTDQSHHKNSQRPPKPDHHKTSVQLSGKMGHTQSLQEPKSCPNIKAEPKTCDSESSTLTTSQQSEMSDSTSGPKIAVLKQNIIKHQLPFPDKRKIAQPKCHREGNFFSPIFEEDSDAVSSVDSDMWWRPSSELNTNNGNVYDNLVEELGSDVDGPTRTSVAEPSGDKESGASSSVRESNESGVDAVPTKDATKEDAQVAPSGDTTNAGTTEGDVELHKVDIVDLGDDVEVVPQSEAHQAVDNVDTKIPVPLDGNAEGSVPLEGSAEKPVLLEGSAVEPVPLEGSAEKPVPLEGSAEKPVPLEGSAEKPVPLENSAEKPVLLDGNAEKLLPSEGNAETPFNPELTTNEAQPDAYNKKEVESDPIGQKDEQDAVVVLRDELQGATGTSGSKHEMLEESMERNDKSASQPEAGEGFHKEVEGAHQQQGEAGGTGEEETKESMQGRQTSPDKPVPDAADQFQLKIKPETRNWSQRRSDQQMCSRLVDISNGHGVVDPWLRKSNSVGIGAWSRLREQESITKDNFELVKRLLAQETVYSREEQLKDYQKCTRFARHMPEDNQKALGTGRQQQSTRANWLAKEQARAMDEFCSKGRSNNTLKRSLSLPPIRKRSLCLENLKSPYSREVLEKDFLAHCACLKNISRHPSDKVWMTAKEHTMFASRLEETDRRVKLATQKIDKMCKNKEPPYAPKQKSKT